MTPSLLAVATGSAIMLRFERASAGRRVPRAGAEDIVECRVEVIDELKGSITGGGTGNRKHGHWRALACRNDAERAEEDPDVLVRSLL